MPIKIPNDLPARQFLEQEGLAVMREKDAARQEVRPMRVALLNLMPQKQKTEIQLARLIGSTPLQVEMTLVTTSSYTPIHTSRQHMLDFYRPWEEIKDEKFDALIITGAPIELLPFEEVKYWDELTRILDWSQSHVNQTLGLCWGAQAALYHFYGVPKYELPQKMFGVFEHRIVTPNSTLLRGFTDRFPVPVSRHTEVRREDLPDSPGIQVLADSEQAGLCMIQDLERRHIYMFNHLEYDATTLGDEYARDVSEGLPIDVPANYFPDDDPERAPANQWRSHAHLFIGNWINNVYQTSPAEISQIGADPAPSRPARTKG
jgi:homoserine O-succinyltransferase